MGTIPTAKRRQRAAIARKIQEHYTQLRLTADGRLPLTPEQYREWHAELRALEAERDRLAELP
jgi:hypothetical protein